MYFLDFGPKGLSDILVLFTAPEWLMSLFKDLEEDSCFFDTKKTSSAVV